MTNKPLQWFRALPFGLAVRLLLLFVARTVLHIPVAFSFSQGGEDIVISCLPIGQLGTYVDVGCHEPIRLSNTFNLYLQGWRGINIDANKDLIDECRRVRRKDISICAAVSDSQRQVTFHKSKTATVSTIDETRLKEWEANWVFAEEDKETVVTQTLTTILDTHLKAGTKVDLLSIDVEGHDFSVLKGLDLTKYRPSVIVVECHSLQNVAESDIYSHLKSNGYTLGAFAALNAYYLDNQLA